MITQPISAVLEDKVIQEVVAVAASATVAEAVAIMTQKGVGAIVVKTESNPAAGIFTERDLMRRVVAEGRDAVSTAIADVMSPNVRSVAPSVSVDEALRLMVLHRYRHLLVMEGTRIVGLISIRDLMYWMIAPDRPIAHEGRPGVVRARTEEAIRSVQNMDRR